MAVYIHFISFQVTAKRQAKLSLKPTPTPTTTFSLIQIKSVKRYLSKIIHLGLNFCAFSTVIVFGSYPTASLASNFTCMEEISSSTSMLSYHDKTNKLVANPILLALPIEWLQCRLVFFPLSLKFFFKFFGAQFSLP